MLRMNQYWIIVCDMRSRTTESSLINTTYTTLNLVILDHRIFILGLSPRLQNHDNSYTAFETAASDQVVNSLIRWLISKGYIKLCRVTNEQFQKLNLHDHTKTLQTP